MNLDRLKKIHKIWHGFSTGSRICSRICTWTQNHGSGSDLASILIEFIRFFQNLINFRRTKNIFILGGFENFWMFWKAMCWIVHFWGLWCPGTWSTPLPRENMKRLFAKTQVGPPARCAPPHPLHNDPAHLFCNRSREKVRSPNKLQKYVVLMVLLNL